MSLKKMFQVQLLYMRSIRKTPKDCDDQFLDHNKIAIKNNVNAPNAQTNALWTNRCTHIIIALKVLFLFCFLLISWIKLHIRHFHNAGVIKLFIHSLYSYV